MTRSPICDLDMLDVPLREALRIIHEAWGELQGNPYVQQSLGIAPTRLPEVSLAEAERRSRIGKSLLRRIGSLEFGSIPHDLALTLQVIRFRALAWSREADWYWTVVDPRGIGFYGMFLPTAYNGGSLLNLVHSQLSSFVFSEPGDADRYLALVADYARLIEQFAARTAGQAARGIRMPKIQVTQSRRLLSAFRLSARKAVVPEAARLKGISSAALLREIHQRVDAGLEPAFDRALQGVGDDYLARAPDAVGIGQYPGGGEVYEELAKLHTTLELTPEQIHHQGHARMMEIERSMTAIRADLGFAGSHTEFLAQLDQDPNWCANSVEGIAAAFRRYMKRLEPRLKEFFETLPKAPYDVACLAEELQTSMTFGYFDPPTRERNEGLYRFNPRNMLQRALIHIPALVYHELMPGHHLHLGTQLENESLHPVRAHSFVNAYNEGWAEYAATFAEEIGMYRRPEERYGRAMFDAFLTSRLVVDTGMNALGWSLERGRDYMRAHSGLSEAEVLTESVRYSCDRPAQALAYKLGDTFILALRERMRRELGETFDLKEFHAAVLGAGALPLRDLEWHVNHVFERVKRRRRLC